MLVHRCALTFRLKQHEKIHIRKFKCSQEERQNSRKEIDVVP